MATYTKLEDKVNSRKIQVESAVRDGAGKNIENNYAKQNGYYSELTAGLAEDLNSDMLLPDNTPYLFRSTGGALEVGNHCYEKSIVGGSVVINQLLPNGDFASSSGWSVNTSQRVSLSISNNLATIVHSESGNDNIYTGGATRSVVGHKYLIRYDAYADTDSVRIGFNYGGVSDSGFFTLTTTNSTYSKVISATTADNNFYIRFLPQATFYISKVNIIDLTQMFGTQIANYIYSLEQANAGSGVAWVKQFLPKDYYPYTATHYFLSVKTSGKKVVGFNQFDGELEIGSIVAGQPASDDRYIRSKNFIRVISGQQYQFTKESVEGQFVIINYDFDKKYINYYSMPWNANGKYTVPDNVYYIKVEIYYGVSQSEIPAGLNVCVHLVWDGERDGEFEAYKEYNYPVSDVELRGILKLDSDNNLYYDGDIYTPDRTVTRRYMLVDLGGQDVVWRKNTTKNNFYTLTFNAYLKQISSSALGNGLCSKYLVATGSQVWSHAFDKIFTLPNTGSGDSIMIWDSDYENSSEADFKAAMSGVYLLFEMETPTTETADAFAEKQLVDNWGTEEYIDDRTIPMPVGHNTEYLPDLKAKVEVAPESPDTDGNYAMKRENGVNTYTNLDLLLLPKLPDNSNNGTYVLQAVKTNSGITYSWVVQS